MTDHAGRQFGNYRLIHLLGQGGFADVYLAEHVHLNTQVAIKVLSMRLTSDNVEQFRTEARTVARLAHPHIVRILDFGVQENTPYLAMDYAPNGSLRQRHPKGTHLPLDSVVNYVKQIAEALQYAHEKKLIHRDIKPENMLLAENLQVVLSDFGIALVALSTRYQNTQEVIGTAAYMAPEQLQGKSRRASDQYSLAIVVYEWLCGDRPFHGSFTEIYSQHMFVPPPPLREKIPELPLAVEEVVLTALAKDPKERFLTIQAFATALEQACQRASSFLTPPPPQFPTPSQFLPPTPVVTTPPLYQVAMPNNARASVPPIAKGVSMTPSKETEGTNHSRGLQRNRVVLLIGLVLLVLLGGSGLFTLLKVNQIATDNAHATATVQTNATATTMVQTQVAATATATIAKNPLQATGGTPIFDDPLRDNSRGHGWDEGTVSDGSFCRFIDGSYHGNQNNPNYVHQCIAQTTDFRNFVFEVQMTIIKGGAGGMIFRADNAVGKWYHLTISQSGQYFLGLSDGFGKPLKTLASGSSSVMNLGLNQSNVITVVANGQTIDIYLNHQKTTRVSDNLYSHGQIGLIVSNAPAEVVFSNAKVWNLGSDPVKR